MTDKLGNGITAEVGPSTYVSDFPTNEDFAEINGRSAQDGGFISRVDRES
jgi:hypothetical protein